MHQRIETERARDFCTRLPPARAELDLTQAALAKLSALPGRRSTNVYHALEYDDTS